MLLRLALDNAEGFGDRGAEEVSGHGCPVLDADALAGRLILVDARAGRPVLFGHVFLPGPVGEAASAAAWRPAARSRDDAQARTSEPYRKPTTGTT